MEQLIDFHAPEVQAVLDTLLKDKSTGKNIIWATDPPEELQTVMYEPVTDRSQITTQQLGLTHYEVVLPRMMKQTDTQQQRTRKKGEVFSPAWVCNKMNNALDADWFRGLGAEESAGQFTVELPQGWQTVETPVQFPICKGRTPAWVQYVQSRRLEVTCGEAPFLASRYDAATGEMIPVARRIGILDRKLRVVSENAATEDEWRKYATHAVQSTYGYEYQGDNLLLARVNLLLTYTETFLSLGCFVNEQEAEACMAYIKSKFCRALLGVLKITQHNSAEKWKYVPLQDFTAHSDIDWSKSMAEIDRQLYRKYDLTADEIEFIETHVKEMA